MPKVQSDVFRVVRGKGDVPIAGEINFHPCNSTRYVYRENFDAVYAAHFAGDDSAYDVLLAIQGWFRPLATFINGLLHV